MPALVIRAAEPEDVPALAQLVDSAYRHYVERIGVRPLPMDDDYGVRVAHGEVYVTGEPLDGLIVLVPKDGYLLIDNVAVRPAFQRRGIGRRLLSFAEREARDRGYPELRLYTNVKMVENRALYARLGYDEVEEIRVCGRDAVAMRKRI